MSLPNFKLLSILVLFSTMKFYRSSNIAILLYVVLSVNNFIKICFIFIRYGMNNYLYKLIFTKFFLPYSVHQVFIFHVNHIIESFSSYFIVIYFQISLSVLNLNFAVLMLCKLKAYCIWRARRIPLMYSVIKIIQFYFNIQNLHLLTIILKYIFFFSILIFI